MTREEAEEVARKSDPCTCPTCKAIRSMYAEYIQDGDDWVVIAVCEQCGEEREV